MDDLQSRVKHYYHEEKERCFQRFDLPFIESDPSRFLLRLPAAPAARLGGKLLSGREPLVKNLSALAAAVTLQSLPAEDKLP